MGVVMEGRLCDEDDDEGTLRGEELGGIREGSQEP